jgi:hypothetical protein
MSSWMFLSRSTGRPPSKAMLDAGISTAPRATSTAPATSKRALASCAMKIAPATRLPRQNGMSARAG